MNRKALVLFPAALLGAFAALTGCENLIGLTDRSAGEATGSDAGPDVVEEAVSDAPADVPVEADTSCTVPTAGDAFLRIANFVPSTGRIDVCLTTKPGDYTGVKPTLASWGGGCPKGFAYKDVSTSFPVASGVYEIKVIDEASADCAGSALATASSVVIDPAKPYTLHYLGDGTGTASAKVYPESRPQGVNAALRFMNAIAGSAPLDCGVSSAVQLPATLAANIFVDVAFGVPAAAGAATGGSIDANGYYQTQIGGGSLTLAVAPTGQTDAILAIKQKLTGGGSTMLTAVGRNDDPRFPTEFISCDELKSDPGSKGVLAKCGNGQPVDFTGQIFNSQLQGPFQPYVDERDPEIVKALSALTADVVCVSEMWRNSDKDALIAAAKNGSYPYGYYAATTYDTVTDDDTDQNGVHPAAWADPPCQNLPAGDGGVANDQVAMMNAALDCVRDACSTDGTDDGVVKPGCDIASACTTQFLPLLLKPENQACYSCAFVHFGSWETFANARTECSTMPKARWAFNGGNGVVMLSKYPLDKAESWVIGATEWRTVVLRAPITLGNGAQVDAYCTGLTTPANSVARPYTGFYGGTATDAPTQWQNELLLQTKKLISYVGTKSTSVKRQAIILGDMYAGPDYVDSQNNQVLSATNVESYNSLVGGLALGVPATYTPACTFCGDNPLVGGAQSTWTSHVFTSNVAVTSVKSAAVDLKDAVVLAGDAGAKVPLSLYYGLQSVVTITP